MFLVFPSFSTNRITLAYMVSRFLPNASHPKDSYWLDNKNDKVVEWKKGQTIPTEITSSNHGEWKQINAKEYQE